MVSKRERGAAAGLLAVFSALASDSHFSQDLNAENTESLLDNLVLSLRFFFNFFDIFCHNPLEVLVFNLIKSVNNVYTNVNMLSRNFCFSSRAAWMLRDLMHKIWAFYCA
jgi:hypothetical protein